MKEKIILSSLEWIFNKDEKQKEKCKESILNYAKYFHGKIIKKPKIKTELALLNFIKAEKPALELMSYLYHSF